MSEQTGSIVGGRPPDLMTIIFASGLTAFVWLVCLSLIGPAGYLAPLAVLVAGAALWVLASAMRGREWALATMLGFALVVPNIYFQRQELHESVTLNAQNGLKLLLWAAMGLVGLARLPRYRSLLNDRAIQSISLYGLIAAASTLWSQTPVYTAVGALGFLGAIMFCCAAAAELSEEAVYRTVVISFGLYAALNIAFAIVIPDIAWLSTLTEAEAPRLQGVSSHPNILGKEMASFICLTVPLALAYGKKRTALVLVVTAFSIIIATRSRTSLGAMLITLALPVLARPQVAKALVLGVVATMAAAMLAVAVGYVPDVMSLLDGASRSRDASEILTLTGRTELWGFVWDKILQAPILGHGFGAADTVLSREWWGAPDASVGAHNTWLQSLLAVGLVGTIPFVYFHADLIGRWFANPNSLTRLITPYLLILGMTEVEIAAHPVMLTIATLLIIAIDVRRHERAIKDQ